MKRVKTHNYLRKVAKKPGIFKAWLLLFISATSIAAAFPIFSPQTAQAQGANVYVDRELFADVTAKIYRDAIGACVNQNGTIPGGNTDAVVAGEWFSSGKAVVGPMLDNDDERRNCSTPYLVNQAMKAFGFDSNTEAACRLGLMVRVNESNCLNGTGAFAAPQVNPSPQEVMQAIDEQRFFNYNQPNNPGFSWTNEKRYIYYARSMEIGCRATPVAPYDSASADQKNLADNSDEYLWMYVIGSDGSKTKMIYQLGDDHKRGSDIGMKNNEENFNEVTFTCLELAQRANDNADAYVQWVQTFPPDEDDLGAGETDEGAAEDETSCDVEGIGWLLCPAMTVISKIVDGVYGVVATMLTVEPISTNTDTPLFNAWAIMRNFANVAFVIAFLVIIYSQITNMGVSNYGIKRMLPRLIIAAILVNISYWVCAVAVDASNIAGASIKGLFDGLIGQVGESGEPGLLAQIGGWTTLTATLLAGAVISVYIGLSVFLPILVGALVAIITVVIILTLRQALIIILIVVSPLAFVAFLLPNTEGLFTSWRKLFIGLLVMFPIIGAIFGGSALAGNIILNSANGNILIQIVGAGVTVIPLFLSSMVMFMMRSLGGVMGRLAGMVNRPDKGVFDRMRRGAEGYRGYRKNIMNTRRIGRSEDALAGKGRLGQIGPEGSRRRRVAAWVAGAGATSDVNREQRRANAERALEEAKRGYVAGRAGTDEAYAQSIAGPTGNAARIQAAAVAALKNQDAQAIKDAEISANIAPGDVAAMGRMMAEAVKQGDSITARAMQNLMMSAGGPGVSEYRSTLNKLDSSLDYNSQMGQSLRDNMLSNHGSKKADAADLIAQAATGNKMSAVTSDPKTWSGLSNDEFVHQKTDSIYEALRSGALDQARAQKIISSPELTKHLGPTEVAINDIANGRTPTLPPPK